MAEDMSLSRPAWAAPLAGPSPSRSDSPRPARHETNEADVVSESRIAYFSMEIGLHPAMPTYSGGLGVLAGDMLRAAADLERADGGGHAAAPQGLLLPGHSTQRLADARSSVEWVVEDFCGSCRTGPP